MRPFSNNWMVTCDWNVKRVFYYFKSGQHAPATRSPAILIIRLLYSFLSREYADHSSEVKWPMIKPMIWFFNAIWFFKNSITAALYSSSDFAVYAMVLKCGKWCVSSNNKSCCILRIGRIVKFWNTSAALELATERWERSGRKARSASSFFIKRITTEKQNCFGPDDFK